MLHHRNFKFVNSYNAQFKRLCCTIVGPESLPKNRLRHSLVGIGQPLLDYTVPLTADRSQHLLEVCNELNKFKGTSGFQQKALQISQALFDDFTSDFDPSSIVLPGGCTLNALRVAQWLLEGDSATTFIGCIGDDMDGERLAELINICGVNAVLDTIQNDKTGKCLHISTDDSSLEYSSHKAHKPMDSYRIVLFPEAASKLSLRTLKQPDARIAITSSSYILASLSLAKTAGPDLSGSQLLIGLSEFAASAERIFCLRLPPTMCEVDTSNNNRATTKLLSPSEWIDLLANVDILFTDLGSALDIAQTLADWDEKSSSGQHRVSRPEIRRRFSEFAKSVLLSEKHPNCSTSQLGPSYASSLYEPMAHSLAATMPGMAERLALCLANLPKKYGNRARIVIILGSGCATGGMVACTSTGELHRLSDFVLGHTVNTLPATFMNRMLGGRDLSMQNSAQEILFRGDGTGKCADGFIGGVLAKLMTGSCLADTRNSLIEALIVGARVAHLISHDRACSFPKRLPNELKLAMSNSSTS